MSGLGLLASSRAGVDREPLYLLDHQAQIINSPDESKDFIQIAICLIDQSPSHAVTALRLAWQYQHPLVSLVHLFPLFDPLRGREDFERLLDEMGIIRTDQTPKP
jgi:hypothetical protein